jgi:ADP-ribose pyrophosphatase
MPSRPKKKATRARVVTSRRVYSGKVLELYVDDVIEPGEVRARREVVRHSGSVATLAVDGEGRVLLVRQYRYPVDGELWELPAGRLDEGETPEEGARRELEEEAGVRAGNVEQIAFFHTTPGFCDERMFVFRATDLTLGDARPEPDERIELCWFTPGEIDRMVSTGEVHEGKTLVALLMEQKRRR